MIHCVQNILLPAEMFRLSACLPILIRHISPLFNICMLFLVRADAAYLVRKRRGTRSECYHCTLHVSRLAMLTPGVPLPHSGVAAGRTNPLKAS